MNAYLDNSATTKPSPAVTAAVRDLMEGGWYNPSALYKPALEIQKRLDGVRETVLNAAGAAEETQGPTEAAAPEEQKLWVKLPSRYDPAMKRIERILTMFPGSQQMIVWCEREKKRIGAKCLIHEGLVLELREMLGEENVVVK